MPITNPINPDEDEDNEFEDNEFEDEEASVDMGDSIVRVTSKVDRNQLAQFVTTIKNAEQQVGEHILGALRHDNTVAVITTVGIGPDGQQHIISAALDPERMKQVQALLQAASNEREDEEPCFGFHCLVKPKRK